MYKQRPESQPQWRIIQQIQHMITQITRNILRSCISSTEQILLSPIIYYQTENGDDDHGWDSRHEEYC